MRLSRGIIEHIASIRVAVLAVGLLLAAAPWAMPGTAALDSAAFRLAQPLRVAPDAGRLPVLATLPRDAVSAPLDTGTLMDLLNRATTRFQAQGASLVGFLPTPTLAGTLSLTAPDGLAELTRRGTVIGIPVASTRRETITWHQPESVAAQPLWPDVVRHLGNPYRIPGFDSPSMFHPTAGLTDHAGRHAYWNGHTAAGDSHPDFITVLAHDAAPLNHTHWYPIWSSATGRLPPLAVVPLETLMDEPAAEPLDQRVVLVGLTGDPLLRDAAAAIASRLNNGTVTVPHWAGPAAAAATLLLALYLSLLVPALRLFTAVMLSLVLLLVLTMAQLGVFLARGEWLWLTASAGYLLLGHAAMMPVAVTRHRRQRDGRALEATRLALAEYQFGEGDLSATRKTVAENRTTDELLDLLYRVALAYEKRRQYPAAAETLEAVRQRRPRYRDVVDRLKVLRSLTGPTTPGASLAGTLVMPGSGLEHPNIGRYRVERELGRGGMGVVYLATDPHINRQVAIKAMDLTGLDSAEMRNLKERFIREAEAAGRLNHPGIVTVHDAGDDGNLAYIAMDYAPGKPLSEHTGSDGLLPVATVFQLVAQAAEALDYAHEHGVVHRDMKPGNMIYDAESDKLMITDFGVARVMDSSRTRTGALLGSPAYMAPEQIAGKSVDGRTDIFALGVSLYQLLTGEFPFDGDSLAALAHQISRGEHRSLKSVRADLPASAARIVNRALKKAPDERFQRAGEMATALRRARI